LSTFALPVSAESALASRRVHVAVVIPCFRAARTILAVIAGIPDGVASIHVVDDACPEGTGAVVSAGCRDPRVRVHTLDRNQGVGGAVMAGYAMAMAEGADILVKMDADGQMDPANLPRLLGPILRGEADYTKGNRFYDLRRLQPMPRIRIFGNAVLSLMTKLSSGYWDIFDPTNGYTALHAKVAALLPMERISKRYFFESDLLFRLNTLRAVVVDVPMAARYGDEVSGLRIPLIVHDFVGRHVRNVVKRVFYNYFLRDLSLASFQLAIGAAFLIAGSILGGRYWYASAHSGVPTLAGSVTLVALLVIVGIQLLLGFLAHDIATVPKRPLNPLIE